MYPHSNHESMNDRFSIAERYKELAGKHPHRTAQMAEDSSEWESSFQMNASNSVLDRILNDAPSNKKYALIPWRVVDPIDRKSHISKAMINLHRYNGYTIVPSSRHRQTTSVSDRVYRQIDNHMSFDKRSHDEEMLNDEAIIIGENILMERDKDEYNRYCSLLSEESKNTYNEIGPNGKANNPETNPRLLGMTYTKEANTPQNGMNAPQMIGY